MRILSRRLPRALRNPGTTEVVLAVDAETVIAAGDLVWLDYDDAKPASAQADASSEALNQAAFRDAFAGVALQSSPEGNTTPIRVAVVGQFEFPCLAATFEVGDFIGVDEAPSGTTLLNQKVTEVPSADRAIGRCARRASTNATTVLVDIISTVMKGGVLPV